MEKFKVSFEANNQQLKSIGTKHASDTYADIEATFVLGEKWTDMDSVSAVWWNDFTRVATVLDSQGKCVVPHEVLARKGCVRVNLVGSIVEGDELITRLTSYSAEAVQVNEKIKLTGSETSEITPSQYEQFVANVKADADRAEAGATASANSAQNASESATASANSASDSAQSAIASAQSAQNASESAITAENAKDDAEDARDKILSMRATAETLEAGSDATASYSDGLLTLGIPRGDRGEQGIQGETGATPNLTIGTVETLAPTEDATATITGTAENPVLNLGVPKGDTGEVSLEDLEALLPTETASDEIVTITDGQSVVPAKSLKVALEPIQEGSGTPSPTNIRPISGRTEVVTHRTGVNLFDKNNVLDGYIDDADGGLKGTAPYKSTHYIRVNGGSSYYVKSEQTSSMWGAWYDENKNFVSGVTNYANSVITAPSNASYVRLTIASSAVGNVNTFAVNYPSTDTEYHAYNGHTYTTDLGRTVYGGTLDVVSGELMVDRAMVDLGNVAWNYNSTYSCWVTSAIANDVKKYPTQAEMITAIAEKYVVDPVGILNGANFTAGKFILGTSGNLFVKTGSNSETPTGAFVYELATPQTYTLTAQEVQLLLGTNNVWSDGKVTLTYNADIQRWVEKKLQS